MKIDTAEISIRNSSSLSKSVNDSFSFHGSRRCVSEAASSVQIPWNEKNSYTDRLPLLVINCGFYKLLHGELFEGIERWRSSLSVYGASFICLQ